MNTIGQTVKKNIVRLAQAKGLSEKDFTAAGINPAVVKSVFRMEQRPLPKLKTMNRFAAALGVETFTLLKEPEEPKDVTTGKVEFIQEIDATFDSLPSDRQKFLVKFYRELLQ